MPLGIPSRTTAALLALAAPVALALAYRAYTMRDIASYWSARVRDDERKAAKGKEKAMAMVTAATGTTGDPAADPEPTDGATGSVSPAFPHAAPASVVAAGEPGGSAPAAVVVWHERLVSKPAALSTLGWAAGGRERGELLTRYVRATMVAFTRTPQAGQVRKMLPPPARGTFAEGYINAMDFGRAGQRVAGVYTVEYRGPGPGGGERVEMRLSPPEGYAGPRGDGVIVAAVEPAGDPEGDTVVFINETWLWRRGDESPTLLEFAIGRWFHSIFVAWLIKKGISAVDRCSEQT